MPPRRRRPRVNRHFKIDHALSPDDREAYLAFLREPRNTIDLAHGGEGLTRPAPTPALTPEQQREATIKRICEILGEPYPPSGSNSTPPAPAPHPSDN